MMGYLKNEKATRECMDEDGFFCTGDLGILDSKGFLRITGRIKELIITAGGENVAPVPIEDKFKENFPACGNIMLIGENRRFISALITFKVEIDMSTGLPSDSLTKESRDFLKKETGESFTKATEAIKNEKVIKSVQDAVERTNKVTVSKAAHIKKFRLLPVDFSMPGGEFTPTMKLKRKVTEKKYTKEVEEMYAEAKM
jgi:long-chain-fatty-acid--CoA ligase ACSBG